MQVRNTWPHPNPQNAPDIRSKTKRPALHLLPTLALNTVTLRISPIFVK